MYPTGELNTLALRKAAVRARILRDRLRCVAFAAEVARPINWLDRALIQWRKISPVAKLAALPLGLLLRRAVLPGKKLNLMGRAVGLLPVVVGALKMFRVQREVH
jgi:hypothetical protein